MATKICDTEPCDKMKNALRRFCRIDSPYDPEKGLLVITLQMKRVGTLQELNIKYCPWCGTRVALGLVDGLEAEIDGRSARRMA
jgi:hypothetical protein